MADTKGTGGEGQVRISITVNNHYTFDINVVTGRQIKETANVPAGFALYRRSRVGNEPIRDGDTVELHDGDHVFARPPASRRAESDDHEEVSSDGTSASTVIARAPDVGSSLRVQ
jgi:hypothetical protein